MAGLNESSASRISRYLAKEREKPGLIPLASHFVLKFTIAFLCPILYTYRYYTQRHKKLPIILSSSLAISPKVMSYTFKDDRNSGL